jgi:hypothetical protein
MANVAVISEVNPFNIGGLRFNPFDPVQQLFSQNLIEDKDEALKHVFKARTEMALHLASLNKKTLVLRDHTHSDYLTGHEPKGFRSQSIINTLKYDYEIKPVLTLRNPIDTFLSLEKNGWSGGVKTFDEYCRRILIMIEAYKDVPTYHYEDFCRDPDGVLKAICKDLHLEFDPSYKDKFFQKKLTGDSGRGKEIGEIKPLPRREYDSSYLETVEASENFQKLREY